MSPDLSTEEGVRAAVHALSLIFTRLPRLYLTPADRNRLSGQLFAGASTFVRLVAQELERGQLAVAAVPPLRQRQRRCDALRLLRVTLQLILDQVQAHYLLAQAALVADARDLCTEALAQDADQPGLAAALHLLEDKQRRMGARPRRGAASLGELLGLPPETTHNDTL